MRHHSTITLSDGTVVELKKQRRTPRQTIKNLRVIGWDTETKEGGWIYLIANSERGVLIDRESIARGEVRTLNADEILAFLTQHKYRNAINVFYNLDYDFGVIVKGLPEENVREIAKEGKTQYKQYKIAWLPRKFFRIQTRNETYAFYDIAQFFQYKPLRQASVEFGVGEKMDVDVPTLTKEKEICENIDLIIKYCLNDAILAQRLTDYFYKKMREANIPAVKPISTAYLSENYFIAKCDIPTFYDAPRRIQQIAYNSYHGGRFEIFRRGYYEGEVYNYDINSAYPNQIKNLPDLRGLKWEETRKYHEDAVLGYYTVKIHYTEEPLIAPIGIKPKDKLIFPIGTFTTTITKEELDVVTDLADVKILFGYEAWWKENEYTEVYPFKEEIERLYNERQRLKREGNDLEYQIKIILNSAYGKFKQIKGGKLGNLTNFIYATEITARTRIQLYKATQGREECVLSYATDGIVTTEKLNLPISKNLGEWDFEQGDAIVLIMSGIYEIYKDNQPIKARRRGIKKKAWQDKLKDVLARLSEGSVIQHKINRPIKVKEAIAQRSKGQTLIGAFIDEERSIDINGDTKRRWEKKFACGIDVLREFHNSTPLKIHG